MLVVMNQEPIEGQSEKGERGSDNGRGQSIASRIEAARQDVLGAPGKHAEGKDGQGGGGGCEVRFTHFGVGEDEVNQRLAQCDGQGGNGHQQEDQTLQGGIQGAVQFLEFSLRVELRQERKGRDAHGLSNHPERDPHQRLGVVQPGDGGRDEIRSEPPHDPVVGKHQRKRQHDGDGELDEQPKAGVAQVQVRGETRARAARPVNLQEEVARQGANQYADREAGDSNVGREQHAHQDDSQVVNHRGQRGHQELSLGVLHGAQDAAQVKAELRRHHQASQKNHPRFPGRIESGRDDFHQLRREDLPHRYHRCQQHAHGADHRGEDVPAFLLAILGEKLGKDGNEGEAQRTTRDEVVQEVGKCEGSVISIRDGVRTDLVGHGPFAQEAENAARQHAYHDYAGSLRDAPRYVGGAHRERCITFCRALLCRAHKSVAAVPLRRAKPAATGRYEIATASATPTLYHPAGGGRCGRQERQQHGPLGLNGVGKAVVAPYAAGHPPAFQQTFKKCAPGSSEE